MVLDHVLEELCGGLLMGGVLIEHNLSLSEVQGSNMRGCKTNRHQKNNTLRKGKISSGHGGRRKDHSIYDKKC